jgi:hypothetical protein
MPSNEKREGTLTFEGQLEIDTERGVIYVHENATGATLLRIQGLPVIIPTPKAGEGLEIGFRNSPLGVEVHFGWRGEYKR